MAYDSAASKKYYAKNVDRIKERHKRYYLEHRDEYRERSRKWYHTKAGQNFALTRRYGIDQSHYDELFRRQGGKCAICGLPESSERFSRLAVDHSHATGVVRGLLCHRCNKGLGMFLDNSQLLKNAEEYLNAT